MTPREAHEELSRALADLADHGQVPPCAGDDRFTSDAEGDHAEVTALCAGCPVIEECAQAAEDEPHGVWAGRCRSKTHSRTRTKGAAA